MSTIGVLALAVAIIAIFLHWSGRYGGRGRQGTTSLRRGPRSHTTSKGRAKVAYETRDDAEARARAMTRRDGVPMNVYQCDTCAKWHIGHE